MVRWLTTVALVGICGSAPAQDGSSTTRELVEQLADPERRRAAIVALSERHGDGVPRMLALLEDRSDRETRDAVLQVLRQLPDSANSTVPMLVMQLGPQDLENNIAILDGILDLIVHVPGANQIAQTIRQQIHDPAREPGDPIARRMHWLVDQIEARLFAEQMAPRHRLMWLRSQSETTVSLLPEPSAIDRATAARVAAVATALGQQDGAGTEHLQVLAKVLRYWDPVSSRLARERGSGLPVLVDLHQPWQDLVTEKKLVPVEIEDVAQEIAKAMLTIDRDHTLSHAAHCTRLAHRDPHTRAEAARTIGMLGRSAQAYVPQLVELSRDPDPSVVREAMTVLGMIGEPARVAIPRLEELVDAGTPQQQAIARAALRQIRRATPRDVALPDIVVAAEESEEFAPRAIATAIELTRQTSKHRDRLVRLASSQLELASSRDERWLVHRLHAAALIDPQVESETLIALVRGDTAVITGRVHSGTWLEAALLAQAAEQLGQREDVDDLALDALGAVLNATSGLRGSEAYQRYQRERLACAEAITRIDQDEVWITQAYGALLSHSDPDTAIRAIRWLATHGPGSQMPQMLRVLRTRDERVRREIVIAMGLIGHRAQGALPHLERFADGDDEVLARLAETSIQQIRGR